MKTRLFFAVYIICLSLSLTGFWALINIPIKFNEVAWNLLNAYNTEIAAAILISFFMSEKIFAVLLGLVVEVWLAYYFKVPSLFEGNFHPLEIYVVMQAIGLLYGASIILYPKVVHNTDSMIVLCVLLLCWVDRHWLEVADFIPLTLKAPVFLDYLLIFLVFAGILEHTKSIYSINPSIRNAMLSAVQFKPKI